MHFFSPCPQLVPPRSRRHNILCRHTPRLVQNDQSQRLPPFARGTLQNLSQRGFAEPFCRGDNAGLRPTPRKELFVKSTEKKLRETFEKVPLARVDTGILPSPFGSEQSGVCRRKHLEKGITSLFLGFRPQNFTYGVLKISTPTTLRKTLCFALGCENIVGVIHE